MSSPPKEKIETKGGHLPAVKAGGMRIVQKHQPTPAPEPPQKDDSEEYISSRVIRTSPQLLPRWPTTSPSLVFPSCPLPSTSTSTSTNPASEPGANLQPSHQATNSTSRPSKWNR
ncbi:death-associated protein 1 isoform X1 [Oreochromis aureus]|uniref:death-associated protein 1 isoform X1 n=1 Tax=Oreochromis aureus TaxID=47969 RepID=UPI001954390A|nr:death-associated protein 1 isoform X1 [Oreochromis aureus]